LRRKLQGLSYSHQGQDPKKLFATFDRDNSGELDEDEFRSAVRKGGRLTTAMLDDAALSKLFRAVDADGSGTVEINELTSWVWGGETAERLADQQREQADQDALEFIRRQRGEAGDPGAADNTVQTRSVGRANGGGGGGARNTPSKRASQSRKGGGQKSPYPYPALEDQQQSDDYNEENDDDDDYNEAADLYRHGHGIAYRDDDDDDDDDDDRTVDHDGEYGKAGSVAARSMRSMRSMRSGVAGTAAGVGLGLSARERGKQANDRHKAEMEARQSKRRAALAQKQARAAREHSAQLAHASALAMRETRGRLEQEASIAAEEEMRLYRARLAVTRWKQRLVRFWLLRWRANALWKRNLLRCWAKLQNQITARHMRDGFHGWAVYTAFKKRCGTLLGHAVRRWRNDTLSATLFHWLSYIKYRRRVGQALDRTASRRQYIGLRQTFFGWSEAMAGERRSRWLASRVESNSSKRLLAVMMGVWRIEARALARAARRKKEEEEALDRAQAREADRLAVLSDMAELLNRRRNPDLVPDPNLPDPTSPAEAVAQAVVADLMDQEREAGQRQLVAEQAAAAEHAKKQKRKRQRRGLVCCGARPAKP